MISDAGTISKIISPAIWTLSLSEGCASDPPPSLQIDIGYWPPNVLSRLHPHPPPRHKTIIPVFGRKSDVCVPQMSVPGLSGGVSPMKLR